MKAFISTCLLFLVLNCSEQPSFEMDFLAGTWKVDGRDTYETWEKKGPARLEGYGYKVHGDSQRVFETLVIRELDGQLVYEATVPDQNEGRAIGFTLNPAHKEIYSFENPDHDFPKKIQYKLLAPDTVLVSVLGENDRGFQLTLIRQNQTLKTQ